MFFLWGYVLSWIQRNNTCYAYSQNSVAAEVVFVWLVHLKVSFPEKSRQYSDEWEKREIFIGYFFHVSYNEMQHVNACVPTIVVSVSHS